jgi:hypothetical protein
MRWAAPSEKDTANETLEKYLWDFALAYLPFDINARIGV